MTTISLVCAGQEHTYQIRQNNLLLAVKLKNITRAKMESRKESQHIRLPANVNEVVRCAQNATPVYAGHAWKYVATVKTAQGRKRRARGTTVLGR